MIPLYPLYSVLFLLISCNGCAICYYFKKYIQGSISEKHFNNKIIYFYSINFYFYFLHFHRKKSKDTSG